MNNIEKLERLSELRRNGALTEEEFQEEKRKIINGQRNFSVENNKFGFTDSSYYVIMHLSQFCSYLIPFLGIAVPIILWLNDKDNDPVVDQHGRNVINWNISAYIYICICVMLMFFLIGFVLIWIPLAMGIIFPIVGAFQASERKVWKYPFSIPFI